jgi:hypothetical protein
MADVEVRMTAVTGFFWHWTARCNLQAGLLRNHGGDNAVTVRPNCAQ